MLCIVNAHWAMGRGNEGCIEFIVQWFNATLDNEKSSLHNAYVFVLVYKQERSGTHNK